MLASLTSLNHQETYLQEKLQKKTKTNDKIRLNYMVLILEVNSKCSEPKGANSVI